MVDYLKANSEYWNQGVYDNPNVESYVFRTYGRVINYEFGLDGSGGENLLDFGCGSGGNAIFFDSKGFNVFGVDQSDVDIERCRTRLPHKADQFLAVAPESRANDQWFGETKFRLIVSFQTLYYLDDFDLDNRLTSLYNMLEEGGIFIATMMHISSWYYDMSERHKDGLRLVKLKRSQDEGRDGLNVNDHFINFTRDEDDLKDKFKIFDPVHSSGYYDGVYRDDQGSEKHLVYIGQKK